MGCLVCQLIAAFEQVERDASAALVFVNAIRELLAAEPLVEQLKRLPCHELQPLAQGALCEVRGSVRRDANIESEPEDRHSEDAPSGIGIGHVRSRCDVLHML